MFGLGKKQKNNQQADVQKTQEQQPASEDAAQPLSDESFAVMPEQYLPQNGNPAPGGASPMSKKTMAFSAGAVGILVAGGAAAYMLFLTPQEPPRANPAPPAPAQNTSQPTATTTQESPAAAQAQDRVARADAFGADGRLAGQLSITIPSQISADDANRLGITVLDATELSLPEGSEIIGGVYSVYPVARRFEAPLSFEIASPLLASASTTAEFYPAILLGAHWREIESYEQSMAGFVFSLSQVPSGHIAIVKKEQERAEPFAATPLAHTADSDGDGLTDKEELLFGADPETGDTDGDSYGDWEEITSGYSPSRALEPLSENELFAKYVNATYGYSAPYPAGWLADSLDQTNKQVLFISDTEEFFEVLIDENPERLPIADWYRSLSPSLANIDLEITIVGGKPAVWSPNGLTLYVANDALVYILNYNNGTKDTISWPNVFEYFYTNFSFGDTESAAPAPAAASTTPEEA